MRYFKDTKAAIELDNSEENDPKAAMKREMALQRQARLYHEHLTKIAARLGPEAYEFFHLGFGETGLHDGILISLSMGDAVGETKPNYGRLRFGKGRGVVTMKILNYERTRLHTFTYKGIRKVSVDIPSSQPLWFKPGETLGHIHSYEIVSSTPRYLKVEWLLDSGGTILIEFEKLVYRKKRIRTESKHNRPHRTSASA